MDLYLRGKTAIVTGAGKGIGRAITKELAIEGVRVLAVSRDEQALLRLQEDIVEAGGVGPLVFSQDVTAPDGPEKIAAKALADLGRIDILINNAGKSRAVDVVAPEEPWLAGMALDFDCHRRLTQELLPQFIARRDGVILNLTSTYELRTLNVSAIAKAAIVQWSKQLAGALGQYGIRVNCLQPGLIDTDNVRGIFPGDERKKFAEREIPLGDFGAPEDMANMAAFLVSPRARYVTGSVAVVDGGLRRHAF
jgi:3-oxoacyl-[acyl-carrier protein] reductase